MPTDNTEANKQLALNTALEASFVTPLASIRGALENLRDYPDMDDQSRHRFIMNALEDCDRLAQGISHLSETVYAAPDVDGNETLADSQYASRLQADEDSRILEIDFSDVVFKSSAMVNSFFDEIDQLIESSGHRWYLLVNYKHCSVWPEAWVSFAHRGQKVNQSYSLGTVHYIEAEGEDWRNSFAVDDPNTFHSKSEALSRIDVLKSR